MAKITDHSNDTCNVHAGTLLQADWADPDIFLVCQLCPGSLFPRKSVKAFRMHENGVTGEWGEMVVGYEISEGAALETPSPPSE